MRYEALASASGSTVPSVSTGDTMKITGILVLVAIMGFAGVSSQNRTCGTQPMMKKNVSHKTGSKRSGRIVGGDVTVFGEWPWQAMLLEYDPNDLKTEPFLLCGGALITENHVLTAAHCVTTSETYKLRVRVGVHDSKNTKELPPETREVLQSIGHKNFSGVRFSDDIKVLVMDKPVKFSQYIQPICIPKANEDFAGKTGLVTGWGSTRELKDTEDAIPESVLREVALPIWDEAKCDAWLAENNDLLGPQERNAQMCTGYDAGGKGDCQGDSGGPLVTRRPDGHWTLVGVVSYGVGCARPNQASVYSKVTYYRDWIEQQINTTLFYD